MKRWVWWSLVAVITAVIFIGFGYTKKVATQKDYEQLVARGQANIDRADYKQAKINFQDALKKKQNDKPAQIYLKQIATYQAGLKLLKQKQYQAARLNFQMVAATDGGSSTLVRRSANLQTELKEVIKELKIFKTAYDKAYKLSSRYQYSASNTKLAVILGYGSIDQDYYRTIRQKAKKLQGYNNYVLRSLGYTVEVDDDSAETKVAPKNDKAISPERLAQAKKELARAGVNTKKLSPTKLKRLIIKADREHKSVVEVLKEK